MEVRRCWLCKCKGFQETECGCGCHKRIWTITGPKGDKYTNE